MFDYRNDFWKNISSSISCTNVQIEVMDVGDKRAVSVSFRLLTQHLLNFTTSVNFAFEQIHFSYRAFSVIKQEMTFMTC